ncbi:MAG: type I DNA topoisomerase [Rhodobacteraceae bacterium]|jgi:DNA topoisomerase-1|nr:type I DNA topoisomerase [Paracoccaceae bacterium]
MAVVVVESPAKAKTIGRYLGPGHTVLASYGHVRDLPAKDGSVDPDDGFAMTWEVAADSRKHLRAIAEALKADGSLILATDPDREGEAISWHLTEALAAARALKPGTPVSRVVFNAITRAAVTAAMSAPRAVDMELVDAYRARRALDYLVGFTLSPVLWRKLPGARSAGRVQSVCLRLIVEREMEIEAFRAREYWGVTAALATPRDEPFEARLAVLDGRRLEKFDLPDAAAAARAVAAVAARRFAVRAAEARPLARNPAPPFMTSTLQQEAGRKFGMGAKATMAAAQRLYEAGHITYMRTDGIDMAPEAVAAARAEIGRRFGAAYVPDQPRLYRNKAKNAQEAHECIRPTDMGLAPEALRLADADQRRLYELVWKRTLASQMAAARIERTTADLASPDGQVELRATGQVVLFDGFLKVYEEGRDDEEGEDGRRLPRLETGEAAAFRSGAQAATLARAGAGDGGEVPAGMQAAAGLMADADAAVLATQSFTQPPPRYTEATLVKRMEELGIGRPSTYAAIVTTIQDRGYVRKEKNRLIPEDKGRLVTAFLVTHFARYLDYDFTAGLEEDLDRVSAGEADWRALLARFWKDFSAAVAETAELRITDVLEKIDEVLAPHLYPPRADGGDPRGCPACGTGRLSLRTARSGGAFIGCSGYPACRYTRPLSAPGGGGEGAAGDRLLGHDGSDPIWLKAGRFGPYVQRGEAGEGDAKPPRASLPKGWAAETVDLGRALRLLSLPRTIGPHPADGAPVEAGIGRFGPFVRHGSTYANLTDAEEVFTLGMNRAVEVLAARAEGRGRRTAAGPAALRTVGEHPDGGAIALMPGRFGPYLKWGGLNASLPKDADQAAVTLEAAVALLAARAGKAGASGRKTAAGARKARKADGGAAGGPGGSGATVGGWTAAPAGEEPGGVAGAQTPAGPGEASASKAAAGAARKPSAGAAAERRAKAAAKTGGKAGARTGAKAKAGAKAGAGKEAGAPAKAAAAKAAAAKAGGQPAAAAAPAAPTVPKGPAAVRRRAAGS